MQPKARWSREVLAWEAEHFTLSIGVGATCTATASRLLIIHHCHLVLFLGLIVLYPPSPVGLSIYHAAANGVFGCRVSIGRALCYTGMMSGMVEMRRIAIGLHWDGAMTMAGDVYMLYNQ